MRKFGVATAALLVLLLAPAARAATITVSSNDDPTNASCTLHDAIAAADSNVSIGGCVAGDASGTDMIDFSPSLVGPITLAGPLPDITSDLNIVGPGSGLLTIDGAGKFQPFNITSFHTDSISGLTIAHGLCDKTCGGEGGAILNAGTLTLTGVVLNANTASEDGGGTDMNAFAQGGAIENSSNGTIDLVLSTVSGNIATGFGATNQNGASGGGIVNNGTLTVDRSTLSGNQTIATATAGGTTNAPGGGINTSGAHQLTVTRSTISGNTSTATGSSIGNSMEGGGISVCNCPGITVTLDRSTVTGNSVGAGGPMISSSGGGVEDSGGAGSSFTIASSTIAGNSAPFYSNLLYGAATRSTKNTILANPLGGGASCNTTNTGSQGFNIDSGASCGFTQPSDRQSTNPMLDSALGSNGGPTMTLALLPGSPAIDQGSSSGGETADQRGLPRPSDFLDIANAPGGDGTDIGAFELQAPPPPDTTPPETFVSGHVRNGKRKASFSFSSNEAGSTFLCKLDKAPFGDCTQRVVFKHLRFGKHVFMVEAKDPAGNVDPTPATFRFKFKRPG